MTKKRNPFRIVFSLWLAPDFSVVEKGLQEPPWIDHDQVDFKRLQEVFAKSFCYGPPVRIRVPNDTIDQVTLHMRMSDPESQRCTDFYEQMLLASSKQEADIIDVRDKWMPLHYIKNRKAAPPPVVIPFLVEATDFEDAMIWFRNTRIALGLGDAVMDALSGKKKQNEAEHHEGNLPEQIGTALKEMFGIPYKPIVLIDMGPSTKKPAWAMNPLAD